MADKLLSSVLRLALFGFVFLKSPALFIFTILLQIVVYIHSAFLKLALFCIKYSPGEPKSTATLRSCYVGRAHEIGAAAILRGERGFTPLECSIPLSGTGMKKFNFFMVNMEFMDFHPFRECPVWVPLKRRMASNGVYPSRFDIVYWPLVIVSPDRDGQIHWGVWNHPGFTIFYRLLAVGRAERISALRYPLNRDALYAIQCHIIQY